ncbi:MAG: thioredoxin domain-containing protein [Sediminibacterium sp.]|nr:thioredoxin domain-containing protein [Sediminibacterium sp.]
MAYAIGVDIGGTNTKFGIVDKDKHADIATKFNISGQPVTVFFKDGVEKQRLSGGGHSPQKLKDILKSIN